MDDDEDFALALQLNKEWNKEASAPCAWSINSKPLSIVDPSWEMIDPVPDIRELFVQFNGAYFDGLLAGVEVKWSPRMTLCAGLCCYEGRGGLCCIKLSQPLLKLRPRKDLVETLLHEMIHALLFVTNNNKDHDGHGPEFHKHMSRINNATGTDISVYHSFHDEVNEYRTHWWRCNGPCVKRPPFYGIVRRAMNRAPSPRDTWWSDHKQKCGGVFTKIKEPENYGKKRKKSKEENQDKNNSDNRKNIHSVSGNPSSNRNAKPISDYFNQQENKSTGKVNANSAINKTNTGINEAHGGFGKARGNVKFGGASRTSATITVKKNSKNSVSETDENRIYQSSSEISFSNIYGFKMSANNKPQNNHVSSFSGSGFTIGSCSSTSSSSIDTSSISTNISSIRERFLRNLENKDNIDKSADQTRRRASTDPNKRLTIKQNVTSANGQSNSKSPTSWQSNSKTTTNRQSDSKSNTNQSNSNIDLGRVICIEDNDDDDLMALSMSDSILVDCPACPAKVPVQELNQHLDICLA